MRRAFPFRLGSENKSLTSLFKRRRPGGTQKFISLYKKVSTRAAGINQLQNLRQIFRSVGNRLPALPSLPSPPSLFSHNAAISSGNKIEPDFDGADIWRTIWHTVSTAKKYIWVSTFIIEDDEVGRKTIFELTEAAKRGCQVILVYDYFGSFGIRQSLFDELKEHGGVVLEYRNIIKTLIQSSWTRKWESPFRRVHQKLLVVDGEVGFCGGMNIGSDYASPEVGGTGRFRDTHCRVMGPAVQLLEKAFVKTLKKTTKEWDQLIQTPQLEAPRRPFQSFRDHYAIRRALKKSKKHMSRFREAQLFWKKWKSTKLSGNTLFGFLKKPFPNVPLRTPGVVQVLESHGVEDRHFAIQESFLRAIQNAKHKISISTPYFMPPPPVEAMLILAAQRGVEIEIITQGKSDVFITSWAAQYAYTKYLKIKGFSIHELVEQELHAKTTAIDNTYASIGSDNLDHISWGYNREAKLTIFDRSIVNQIKQRFEKDKVLARKITPEYLNSHNFLWKGTAMLAYHFYHLVYPWNGIFDSSKE